MHGRGIALAFLLMGCNQVYGIDETRLADSIPSDALPPTCRTSEHTVDKDTFLIDDMPRGLGDADVIDNVHPALFRFAIGIAGGEHVAAAVLHVIGVERADTCGPGCGPCPTEQATSFRAYWNESSWSDDVATRDNRRAATPWMAPFATGADDRSALVAEHPLTATVGPLDLPIRMVDIAAVPAAPWLRFDSAAGLYELTFQILTDEPIALATEERGDGTCADNLARPTLTATLCR